MVGTLFQWVSEVPYEQDVLPASILIPLWEDPLPGQFARSEKTFKVIAHR
jgi:hypothetical protein